MANLLFTPREIIRRTFGLVWAAHRRAVLAAVTLGGLMGFAWAALAFLPPSVELAWIDSRNGESPVAATLPSERFMPLSIYDMYRHRLRVPFQLGIRNRSALLSLSDVDVTLEYPHVQIQSTAIPLASEDSSVIMQHAVGVLRPGRAFYPLKVADQVLIPVDSILSAALTVDGAGIPQYVEFMTRNPEGDPTSHVILGAVARVSAAGRFREFTEQLTVPMWLGGRSWWPPPIPMKERPATREERSLFVDLFQSGVGDTVFGGRGARTKKTNRLVEWACVSNPAGRFSTYTVDRRPLRVQADTNKDWLVDFELLSRPSGKGHVTVTLYSMPRPMDLPFVSTRLRPALPGETMIPPSPYRLRN